MWGGHEATRRDSKCSNCHKERHRVKAAKYRLEHPEEAKAKLNAWRKLNPEKTSANKRKFQENNRSHRTAYQNARHADKLKRTPKWANADNIKCIYEVCGLFRSAGVDIQVDHIIPLRGKLVSGLHVENNLRLLSAHENRTKKNTYSVEATI